MENKSLNLATQYAYNLLNNIKEINWIESNLNIKLTEIQKEYIKHISKNDKSITLKKRQTGITTANLCWNIYNCCNEKNVNSLILSRSSRMLYNLCLDLLDNSNISYYINPLEGKINIMATEGCVGANDNLIHILHPKQSRGCGPTHLSADDIDDLSEIRPLSMLSKKIIINLTKENEGYSSLYKLSLAGRTDLAPLHLI
jgi:hypothetical protein